MRIFIDGCRTDGAAAQNFVPNFCSYPFNNNNCAATSASIALCSSNQRFCFVCSVAASIVLLRDTIERRIVEGQVLCAATSASTALFSSRDTIKRRVIEFQVLSPTSNTCAATSASMDFFCFTKNCPRRISFDNFKFVGYKITVFWVES